MVSRDKLTVTTAFGQGDANVTVTITGNRPSFFVNLLPPGGWNLHTNATAASYARQGAALRAEFRLERVRTRF